VNKSFLAGFIGMSAISTSLFASTVTITDFETPTQGPPGYGSLVPTGFLLSGTSGSGLQTIPNTPESGNQFYVFNDNNGAVGQLTNDPSNATINALLGTYQPGTTYTLSFYVARTGNPIGTYYFNLLDGSTVLTPLLTNNYQTPLTTQTFTQVTETYVAPLNADGAQLNLAFGENATDTTSEQVAMDLVQLTTLGTPEPATACLLSLIGGFSLLRRQRRSNDGN
jgi:hypothetical protein